MPVHAKAKVDSKCFTLSMKADAFLSLGNTGKEPVVPPDFWKELSQDPEAVSRRLTDCENPLFYSYFVCLIAKLISLDSDHGLKPLPEVYRDLVELPVDYSKYKHWSAKSLPANAKVAALELQCAIVNTIFFLKEFYGYTPNVHLRHMYLRWNLARNHAADGSRKIADVFEEKIITSFSVAQSRQLLHSPTHSSSPTEKDERIVVATLVDECYQNHRRASFGVLPPYYCRLCNYLNVADGLSYLRLRDLVARSPALLNIATQHVLTILQTEVQHAQDYGEREVLLPLLHLFREFLTMMSSIDTMDAYRSILQFYMWPVAHSGSARKVLDLIMQEGRVKGTTFRRRVLQEHDTGVKLRTTKIRSQLVHIMVDTSHPLSRGSVLWETFKNKQEKPDQWSLQRMLIRNSFRSVLPSFDIVELEGKLQNLSSDALKSFCQETLETMERAANMSTTEDVQTFLTTEIDQLHQRILHHAESEEQRDSALSCSSIDCDLPFTEDALGSFAFLPPYIPAHSLDNCQYPTILTKLRDILVKTQQPHSPVTPPTPLIIDGKLAERTTRTVPQRTFSNSSRTSIDSTGSSTMEQDASQRPIPNGHVTEPLVSSRDVNVMSPDSGHMASPSPQGTRESTSSQPLSPHGTRGSTSSQGTRGSTSSQPEGTVESSEREDTRTGRGSETERKASESETDTGVQNGDSISAIDTMIDSVFPEGLSQDSSDTSSKSSSKGGVEERSDTSRDRSTTEICDPPQPRQRARVLVRRATAPSGLGAQLNRMTSSPGSVRKNYINVAGHQSVTRALSNPSGSMRVKTRPNPSASLSIRQKKRPSIGGSPFSPLHKPNLRVLKIVLAGSDMLVTHAAKAYAYLQCEEPNLLSGLEVRFYHVPLSRASCAYNQLPELSSSGGQLNHPDLPEPTLEQVDTSGNDVYLGRFLAHMDSWYDRNVMMAIHNLLRLIPHDKSSKSPASPLSEPTHTARPSSTPSKLLIETVANFCREANHCVRVKMFRVKMALKSEKSQKIERREVYMLHRMDIQRLSGKKGSRQVKTFDGNITMTELSLDNSFIRSDMVQMKDVWSVRACNIPRPGDSGVPNPETECFELTIITAQVDGGRGRFASTKYRPLEENQYHVYDLILETRDKPLTVMVDGDSDFLIENVIRLEISPAYMDQSFALSSLSGTRRNDHRLDRQLQFPLMTYWPIDL